MVALDEHFRHSATAVRTHWHPIGKSVPSAQSADHVPTLATRPLFTSGTSVVNISGPGTPMAGWHFGISECPRNDLRSLATDRRADGFGNALGFTPSGSITPYLYNQQFFDIISGQYYLRSRNYDPATGTFTQQDGYTIAPGDTANANFYLYAGADPANMDDPSGMFSMTLGTAVHQYLSRTEFEINGAGGASLYYRGIDQRSGNRYVSTIIRKVTGIPTFSLPFRPDMVGIYGPANSRMGDVYELKAGPITLLTQPGAIPSFVLDAATQIGDYLNLLVMAPSVRWQQGTQLWKGIKDWPNFNSPLKPPGTSLVTFDYYSAVPGVILYDFVPTEKALELATEGALYATAAAALYQIGLELAPAVSGGLAYMADIASSLAVATLTGFEGGVA